MAASPTDILAALQNAVVAINALNTTTSNVNTQFSNIDSGLKSINTQLAKGGLVGIQLLTSSSGTYTPTGGTRGAMLIAQAAGGGGGGHANAAGEGNPGCGAAGETRLFPLSNITGTYPYAIGAFGGGAAPGNNPGGTAGDTTFGSPVLVTAKGGTGGGGSTGANTGADGTTPTGSGGILLPPTDLPSHFIATGGKVGGSTIFGVGGNIYSYWAWVIAASLSTVITGQPGKGYGAGGCGSYKFTGTGGTGGGGAGAPGFILVIEFG